MNYRFEWNPAKAASNLRKHGIGFEAAVQVFDDPYAIQEHDRIEDGEPRWQIIGRSGPFVILLVAYTYTGEEGGFEYVRIISARRADAKERKRYEQAYIQARS
jgi:uncharacterized protein